MRFPLLVVLLSLVLGVPALGAAQASPQEGQYNTLIQQALAEFNAQRWQEARSLFQRAHAIDPGAKTLRAIGNASFELGDYADAVRNLSASLVETRRPLSAEQQASAREVLARAETFVARVNLTLSPVDAHVLVDATPPYIRDGIIIVNPGRHELAFQADGFVEQRRMVDLRADAPVDLSITLVSESAVALAGPAAPEARPRTWKSWVGFSLVGVAGASAITSIATGIAGNSIHNDLESSCAGGVCDPSEADRIDRGRALVNASTATTVVAVATGAGGLVLLLLERHARNADDEPARIEVTPGPGTAGLGMTVSF